MSDQHDMIEQDAGLVNLQDFDTRPAAIHNFDGDPPQVWARVSYATGPSCGKGESIIDKPFGLAYWYLHEIVVPRDDGTKVRAVRTVLVSDKGDYWGFVSDGVYNSLRNLITAMGRGPYDPPIAIVVRRQSTGGARRFYAIEPAPERSTKKGGEPK